MAKATVPTNMDLKGHLLLAMPDMSDPRFAGTVILVCSHDDSGSMGFVLNKPVQSPGFTEILDELSMQEQIKQLAIHDRTINVNRGGPVEQGRGFVIHSLDFSTSASARVNDLAGVTATLDVLRILCGPQPPAHYTMLLGYSGWSAGQLEQEIAQNGWLTMPATPELVFDKQGEDQYEAALKAIGISHATLSPSAGHA